MSEFRVYSGVVPSSWLQHHLPWLGLLALVLDLFREEPMGFDADQLNG